MFKSLRRFLTRGLCGLLSHSALPVFIFHLLWCHSALLHRLCNMFELKRADIIKREELAVDVVAKLWVGHLRLCFWFPAEAMDSSLVQSIQTASGAYTSLWVPQTPSPGIKQPACEDECPHPSSAKVQKEWSRTSTSLHAYSDNFTFNRMGLMYLLIR